MATTIVIKAQVDTGDSAQELLLAEQGLSDMEKAAKKTSAELNKLSQGAKSFLSEARKLAEESKLQKSLDDLNKKVDRGNMSFKEIATSIKQYRDIALKAGEDSVIGQQAIKRAGELKDQLKAVGEQVSRIGDGGRKMQAALQLSGTVVAGYSAFQGVTAMLGVENEQLLQTLTKLQAATSTLTALEQIRSALEKESFLMIQARIIATNALTAAQTVFNAVANANPIVWVVTGAIAALVWLGTKIQAVGKFFHELGQIAAQAIKYMTFGLVDFTDETAAATAAQEKLAKKIEKATGEARRFNNAIDEQIKKNREAEAALIRKYDNEIKLAQAAGRETSALEREKLKVTSDRIAKEIKLEQMKLDNVIRVVAQQKNLTEEQAKNLIKSDTYYGQQFKAAEENIKKLNEALEDADVDLKAKQLEIGRNYAEKVKEQREKEKEEEERMNELRFARQRAFEDLVIANMQDGSEKRIAELKLRQKREAEDLAKEFPNDMAILLEQRKLHEKQMSDLILQEKKNTEEKIHAETVKANERARKADVEAAQLKLYEVEGQFQLEYEAKKALLEAQKAQEISAAIEKGENILLIEADYKKKQAELDKKYSDDKIAMKQKERDAILFFEQNMLNGVAAIGNLFIKNEEKAAKFKAITTAAQMALDTAKAIGNVVAGATAAAAAGGPAAPFLIAGYIASGIATVMSNMKTALDAFKSAKVGSAPTLATASGGSGGGSGPSTVNITPQNASTQTDQFFQNQQRSQTVTAVVVEAEQMTNVQNRIKTIESLSKI